MPTVARAVELYLDPTDTLDQPTLDKLVDRFGHLDVAACLARDLAEEIPAALDGLGKTKTQLRAILTAFTAFLTEVRGLAAAAPAAPNLGDLDHRALLARLADAVGDKARGEVMRALSADPVFMRAVHRAGGRVFARKPGGGFDPRVTGDYVADLAAGSAARDWAAGAELVTLEDVDATVEMVVIDPFDGQVYPVGAKDVDDRVVSEFPHLAALTFAAFVDRGAARDWMPRPTGRLGRADVLRRLSAPGAENTEPLAPILRAYELARRPGGPAERLRVPMTRPEAEALLGVPPAAPAPRPRIVVAGAGFTSAELAELASVFATTAARLSILEPAGFPPARLPAPLLPSDVWWYEHADDPPALATVADAVHTQLTQRGLHARQLATELGMSHSTVVRLMQHSTTLIVGELAALARWAGLDIVAVPGERPTT